MSPGRPGPPIAGRSRMNPPARPDGVAGQHSVPGQASPSRRHGRLGRTPSQDVSAKSRLVGDVWHALSQYFAWEVPPLRCRARPSRPATRTTLRLAISGYRPHRRLSWSYHPGEALGQSTRRRRPRSADGRRDVRTRPSAPARSGDPHFAGETAERHEPAAPAGAARPGGVAGPCPPAPTGLAGPHHPVSPGAHPSPTPGARSRSGGRGWSRSSRPSSRRRSRGGEGPPGRRGTRGSRGRAGRRRR